MLTDFPAQCSKVGIAGLAQVGQHSWVRLGIVMLEPNVRFCVAQLLDSPVDCSQVGCLHHSLQQAGVQQRFSR